MKCNCCQSEWTSKVSIEFKQCPFCGEPLQHFGPSSDSELRRRYFYCSTISPTFGRYDYPLKNRKLPANIDKAITSFIKRYVNNYYFAWPSFWNDSQQLIHGMFFYEENGVCYEFFSGCELGQFTEQNGDVFLSGKIHVTLYLKGGIDYNDIDELTIHQFADKIQQHIAHKEQIKTIMTEFIRIHYMLKGNYEQTRRVKEQEEQKSRSTVINWMNEYITNR